MGDQEKSFISVIIGDYVAVPKKFTNNIRGQIQKVVKLEVSDGKTYDIQIANEHNGLVFQSGWAKFASAYELEQCDMLVFRYRGNSHFKVQIFDPSGCEKEFSCVMMDSKPSIKGRCGHRMSTGSQNAICKECVAHHYWHQMDKRCFFVVMIDGDFKDGLIIPKKFANNVQGQISKTIKLNTPDGEIFDIEVAKRNNLFRSGWAAFASAYELEQGDTLVFGYSGDSHFKVQIFSPSTCEKELSCFPINSIPCVQERNTSHDNRLQSAGSERTNRACTICKDCIANHYWHMDYQDRCFFKVMSVSNFKNKLTIPQKFVSNVGEQISEEVQLEVPNGKTYRVKLDKEQNDLVLGSGWANFASAYELNQGDFLVFTLTGHSHFKVRIFDSTTCEKELSCVLMDSTPYKQERSISHDNPMQPPTRKRSAEHCVGSSSHLRKTSKMSPTNSPSRKSTEDVDIIEPMNSFGFQKSWLVFPLGCNLTCEQKAKIDALEQKIISQIPLYITAMDMTSMYGGLLAISKDYAVKYLLDQNGTIILSQLDGSKTWSITLDINTAGSYALSTGWLDFIRDNSLREGDICVFEPSKSKRRVTLIFHPLEKIARPKSPGYVPSSRSPAHGVTEPGYIAPRFTILTDQQNHQVEEKVRAIRSPYHLFLLMVQASNIGKSCTMAFCSEYAKKYLQGGHDTITLLCPKKTDTWEAEIEITNNRPNLRRGWRQFASDNELKLGDICLFELMESKDLTMTVHIIPKQDC
ncbi:unnamed protein product, partial [Urochloa decumbens]